MKALQTTTRNLNVSHKGVRLVLTVVGILTAILCSMALLQDARSAEVLDAKAPRLMQTSKIVMSDLVGKVVAWL